MPDIGMYKLFGLFYGKRLPYTYGAFAMSLKFLLENYAGIKPDQIIAAWKLRSWWFVCNKTYPGYIIADERAYLLSASVRPFSGPFARSHIS